MKDHPDRHSTPSRPRDPGSPVTGLLALVSAVVLFALVAIEQNSKPPPVESDAVVTESSGPSLEADMAYRVSIKFHRWVRTDPTAERALAAYTRTPFDRVCLAVVIGEINDAQAAADHLRELADSAAGESVADEARLLARVYEHAAENMEPRDPVLAGVLSQAQRDELESRFGYYARVALTHGLPKDDPLRIAPRSGGWVFVFLTLMMLGVLGVIGLGGLLFIVAMVLIGMRKIRPSMARPQPGGSVFLEVFSLFVGLFLAIKIVVGVLDSRTGMSGQTLLLISLALQWGLLLVPVWPMVRGMSGRDWRHAIGLTAPKGVFREIGAGIVGYVAGLPLFVLGVMAVVVMMAIKAWFTGVESDPPANPMIELLASQDMLFVVLFALTAVIWAPLCEELVFRGALLRHMSGRMPLLVGAVLTAVLFAFMHNYGPMLTPPLIALGFVFAMMRIWRGSIVACITAHALHNGTLVLLVFFLLHAIGDNGTLLTP